MISLPMIRLSVLAIFAKLLILHEVNAFAQIRTRMEPTSLRMSSEVETEKLDLDISKLKTILRREYTTFFDPMYTEYYSSDVSFDDPMTSLNGVQSYQTNVDMLASRTLLGKFLFSEAGIVLHNISGGETDGKSIQNIITRWTLRLTAKVFPWSPTARFTGVSVYKVKPDPSKAVGVQIVGQTDYWDSINILPNSSGEYKKAGTQTAIKDFLGQLAPGGFQAQTAAPELPYQLLRRGNGYEVRLYPSYCGVKLPYRRRDEGFGSLGAFTRGMNPLSPSLMEVQKDDTSDKYMMWPIAFTEPGKQSPVVPNDAKEKAGQGQWRTMRLINELEKVVAVKEFSDVSMGPVVRKADKDLRALLDRDGLRPAELTDKSVTFAQYDAIFSMGKRRGEVWIDLANDGHPW